MNITKIGAIEHGIDGTDTFFLVEMTEEECDEYVTAEARLEYVQNKVLSGVYRPCTRPGGSFCGSVLVSPKQYSDTAFICIAESRYDN